MHKVKVLRLALHILGALLTVRCYEGVMAQANSNALERRIPIHVDLPAVALIICDVVFEYFAAKVKLLRVVQRIDLLSSQPAPVKLTILEVVQLDAPLGKQLKVAILLVLQIHEVIILLHAEHLFNVQLKIQW